LASIFKPLTIHDQGIEGSNIKNKKQNFWTQNEKPLTTIKETTLLKFYIKKIQNKNKNEKHFKTLKPIIHLKKYNIFHNIIHNPP